MPVNWTDSALLDLLNIRTYISQHSQEYARSMVERIVLRTEQLKHHPRSGSMVPEFGDQDIRELLERPYRIVYRVYGDRVDVVAIVHAARLMPPVP
jgi:toxin ParE1/3/4